MKKITLLLHGAYVGSAYEKIFNAIDNSSLSKDYDLKILNVVYEADYKSTCERLKEIGGSAKCTKFVRVKDLINPGFYNINRQIYTVCSGLKAIEKDRFVIKLRNDQWISFNKLILFLEKTEWLSVGERRIITTNCYTRKDRLYHPSDMFLCGWQPDLEQYYDMPLRRETFVDLQMREVELAKFGTKEDWLTKFECPENILCKHYLNKRGWKLENTLSDSYDALNTYFWLVNSWNIDYRWNKKRNPVLNSGTIILPCIFDMAPFPGAPLEHARCYMAEDFDGYSRTFRDVKYEFISKVLWKFKLDIKQNVIDRGYKILNSGKIPGWLLNILVKTKIRSFWIKLLSS